MNTYSVYKHTAPSGRVYIGISKNPERRWNCGRGYKYNPYFSRCIQKYGWDNISHEIILCGLSLEDAKEKEVELIQQYKSNQREFGYNISGGGDCAPAEESRIKMSIARIGNKNCVGRNLSAKTRDKISSSLKDYYLTHEQYFLGKHHTPKTIEKLKARIVSEETRRKLKKGHPSMRGENNPSARRVVCFSKDGTLVKVYSFAKQAAEEVGVDISAIIKCCRGKAKSCGGFIWKYDEPGIYPSTILL